MTVTTFEEMPAYVVFGAVSPLGSGPWRMIWCHERCHKAENEARRVRMESTVRHHSGTLISFKKARQVGRWASRASRPPFVLVTDWREAQPCMQALAEFGRVSNLPVLFIVMCDTHKQQLRAAAWTTSADVEQVRQSFCGKLPAVRVVERGCIPADLLGGLALRAFGEASDDDVGDDDIAALMPRPPACGPCNKAGAPTAAAPSKAVAIQPPGLVLPGPVAATAAATMPFASTGSAVANDQGKWPMEDFHSGKRAREAFWSGASTAVPCDEAFWSGASSKAPADEAVFVDLHSLAEVAFGHRAGGLAFDNMLWNSGSAWDQQWWSEKKQALVPVRCCRFSV
mmetsp:Transcript_72473/g.209784  ORF Transcript_72473/g.209784 Transcript_72473/m.209784 type:complete len:341 (-) Transcript_72473:178-1200(-)